MTSSGVDDVLWIMDTAPADQLEALAELYLLVAVLTFAAETPAKGPGRGDQGRRRAARASR